MKEIPLGGKIAKRLGLKAICDDADYDLVKDRKWHAWACKCRTNGFTSTYYAATAGGQTMHRILLGLTDPKQLVDHKNRNGLDNRRENLRLANYGQNLANRPKARKNTSGYKGAYWNGKTWFSTISINNRLKHLGQFKSVEEAAMAYDRAALAQWGEFACLNFPEYQSFTSGL